MNRNILIVEDDFMQLDLIQEVLSENFPGADISDIQSEHEFYEQIPTISATPPSLILMDLMLRWTQAAPEDQIPPLPENVKKEGYYRAGIRCVRKLLEMEKNGAGDTPILLFSVLSDDDLKIDLDALTEEYPNVNYLQKAVEVAELVKVIRDLVPHL